MERQGYYLVLFTAVVSGVSIFINKFGVAGINSSVFTTGKNIVSAVLLFSSIFLLGELRYLKLRLRDWLMLALIGLVGGSVPFLLFFRGLQLTSAATAGFIHKTMFVYVAVLAHIFLGERINRKFLAAAVLLLIGNALFLELGLLQLDAGAMLVLAATVLWAVENIISKHVLVSINPRVVAWGRMFFGSVFMVAFLALKGQFSLLLGLSQPQLGWVLLSSVFLFFYVFSWYWGLSKINVSSATCILLLGSIITTGLSVLSRDMVLTFPQAIGALTLLLGIAFAVSSYDNKLFASSGVSS